MIAPLRGWRLAIVGAAVLLVVVGVAVLVGRDDGNDADTVAARATTTTSTQPLSTTTASAPSTTAVATTTTLARTAPAPVATSRPAPAACPAPAPGSDFDGFGAAEIVIVNDSGSRRSCVLTADTSRQQARGLMHQDDLDGYAGMIFRFATAEEQSFWMRNTRIPLSIAFFDAGGAYVSSADMEPCGDRSDCPTYPSRGPAKFALEVLKGQLPAVGATPGSRLGG